MGKLVVTEFVSVDGVFEDPGGAEGYEHGGWTLEYDRGAEGNKFKLDVGAAKAAEALRPEGRLAVFWNVQQPPPDVAEAFAEVYRRVLPDTPFSRGAASGLQGYSAILAKAAEGIRPVGGFGDPEQWR